MSQETKEIGPIGSPRKRNPSPPPPPPTPPESVKSFQSNASTIIPASPTSFLPPAERSLFCSSRIRSSFEHFFDWALKLIGVCSAVVFGIWAPVSYRLQEAGNKSNDDAQERLVRQVDGLRKEIEGLRMGILGLGALRAWEFCAGRDKMEFPACKALLTASEVNAVIEDMVDMPQSHIASRRSVSTGHTAPPRAMESTTSTPKTEIATLASTFVLPTSPSEHDEIGELKHESATPLTPAQVSSTFLSVPGQTASPSLPTFSHTVPEIGKASVEIQLSMQMATGAGFLFGLLVWAVLVRGRRVFTGKKMNVKRWNRAEKERSEGQKTEWLI